MKANRCCNCGKVIAAPAILCADCRRKLSAQNARLSRALLGAVSKRKGVHQCD